jgi:hypothetical protein
MLPNDGACDVYVSPAACCSRAMLIFFICNSACVTRLGERELRTTIDR